MPTLRSTTLATLGALLSIGCSDRAGRRQPLAELSLEELARRAAAVAEVVPGRDLAAINRAFVRAATADEEARDSAALSWVLAANLRAGHDPDPALLEIALAGVHVGGALLILCRAGAYPDGVLLELYRAHRRTVVRTAIGGTLARRRSADFRSHLLAQEPLACRLRLVDAGTARAPARVRRHPVNARSHFTLGDFDGLPYSYAWILASSPAADSRVLSITPTPLYCRQLRITGDKNRDTRQRLGHAIHASEPALRARDWLAEIAGTSLTPLLDVAVTERDGDDLNRALDAAIARARRRVAAALQAGRRPELRVALTDARAAPRQALAPRHRRRLR